MFCKKRNAKDVDEKNANAQKFIYTKHSSTIQTAKQASSKKNAETKR